MASRKALVSDQLAIEKLTITDSSTSQESEELAVEDSKQFSSNELKDALRKLYSREDMTLEFAYKIRSHAEILSVSLCTAFSHLKAIMERHEPLIRRRWGSKTRSERRALLLDVMPTMASNHRPDLAFVYDEPLAMQNDTPSLADHIMFPYINLEDLCTPHSLLMFLNARAFNLPWTFVNTEAEFSPSATTPSCLGRNGERVKMDFRFTKNPEPGKYGEAVFAEKTLSSFEPVNEEFYTCQRQGLQMLYVQERIYTLLSSCARAILHDMSEDSLQNAAISKAHDPSVAGGPNDTVQAGEHKIFSDTVMLGPYRARSCVDFHRLRAYFDGFFNNAKDHVWALREDPSYLADAIKEMASHRPELIKDTKGRVHWRVGRPSFMALVMKNVIVDAYTDLVLWKSLFESTDHLCQLVTHGEIENLHDFSHRVDALQFRAAVLLERLLYYVLTRAPGSPELRQFYTRFEGRHGINDTCRHRMHIERNATADDCAIIIMHLLDELERLGACKDIDEMVLFNILDLLDMVLKDDWKGRTTISPLLASDIAKLSIAAECLRQIYLWMATPEMRMFVESHDVKCKGTIPEDGFMKLRTMPIYFVEYEPLVSVADPSQGCLTYPVHHRPNRHNVEQMRKAEQNLDKFWSHVDSWFVEKTLQEQQDYIMPIISRKVRRTLPWTEKLPSTKLDHVYVPIPAHLHDTFKQITGVFDRSSKTRKMKKKTHGRSEQSQPIPNIPECPVLPDAVDKSVLPDAVEKPEPRLVDKRTLKTLTTIFGTDSYSLGEVSRTIKWDAFVRAMICTGFAAEKLQGSAWQFTPHGNTIVERSIQFHEPHPDSDVPYAMARRFGRRLERVYGWTRETFRLA